MNESTFTADQNKVQEDTKFRNTSRDTRPSKQTPKASTTNTTQEAVDVHNSSPLLTKEHKDSHTDSHLDSPFVASTNSPTTRQSSCIHIRHNIRYTNCEHDTTGHESKKNSKDDTDINQGIEGSRHPVRSVTTKNHCSQELHQGQEQQQHQQNKDTAREEKQESSPSMACCANSMRASIDVGLKPRPSPGSGSSLPVTNAISQIPHMSQGTMTTSPSPALPKTVIVPVTIHVPVMPTHVESMSCTSRKKRSRSQSSLAYSYTMPHDPHAEVDDLGHLPKRQQGHGLRGMPMRTPSSIQKLLYSQSVTQSEEMEFDPQQSTMPMTNRDTASTNSHNDENMMQESIIELTQEQIHNVIEKLKLPPASYDFNINKSVATNRNESDTTPTITTATANTAIATSSTSTSQADVMTKIASKPTFLPPKVVSKCTFTPPLSGTTTTTAYTKSPSLSPVPVPAASSHRKKRTPPILPLRRNSLLSSKPEATKAASLSPTVMKASIGLSLLTTTTNTSSTSKNSKDTTSQNDYTNIQKKVPSSGRWTREEHEAFLAGLKIFGREWKKVAQNIPTRTSAQIRSHAQKYFAKLLKDEQAQSAAISSATSGLRDSDVGSGSGIEGVALTNDWTGGSAVNNSSSGGNSGRILTLDHLKNEYPRSVLDRAEKILKDPKGTQMEVEDTLTRLRSRYCELQRQVQAAQNRENETYQMQINTGSPSDDSQSSSNGGTGEIGGSNQSAGGMRRNESNDGTNHGNRTSIGESQQQGHHEQRQHQTRNQNKNDQTEHTSSLFAKKKKQNVIIESVESTAPTNAPTSSLPVTDQTPVSIENTEKQNKVLPLRLSAATTAIGPATKTPPIRLSTKSLALHSEELIALHVLGGELYRSGSNENLPSLVPKQTGNSEAGREGKVRVGDKMHVTGHSDTHSNVERN